MNTNHLILWSSLIVPWLTLIFINKKVLRHYIPVAVFTALILTIVSEIGYTFQWWKVLDYIVPWGYITMVTLAYGLFFVGTIWIFALTYPKFWLFMLVNIAIDLMQAFVFSKYIFEGRLYKLVNLTHLHMFLLMISIAVLIYVYQKWQEGALKKIADSPNNEAAAFTLPFADKEKVK